MNEVFLLLNEHYRKLPMPKKGKEEERVREEIEKAKKKEEEERKIWERLNEKFGNK